MTGYLIFWAVSLATLAVFVGYWVRRIERTHRERMAAIEGVATVRHARPEARDTIGDQIGAQLRELVTLRAAEAELERALQASTPATDVPVERRRGRTGEGTPSGNGATVPGVEVTPG